MNRFLAAGILVSGVFASAVAIPTGPEVGSTVPDFTLVDQFGKTQSVRTVLGPEGGLIVFYRSADW